jgi:AraC-like DNA-binding protein
MDAVAERVHPFGPDRQRIWAENACGIDATLVAKSERSRVVSDLAGGKMSCARLEHTCSLRALCALKGSDDDSYSSESLDRRVSHALLVQELDALAQDAGDEIGVRSACASAVRPFDFLLYVTRASCTAWMAIQCALRYVPLAHDALSLHCVSDDDCAYLSLERPDRLPWSRELSEFLLTDLILALRLGSGMPFTPGRVSFAHPPPSDVALRSGIFGCPVDYQARVDSITFPLHELTTPIATEDSCLHGFLIAYAENELTRLFATWSFSDRVRRLLRELFPTHAPAQDEIADKLQCSVRTLHRHLRAEGTSYRKLMDEVREELAMQYLVRSRLDVGKAASLLGYAQASAFRRAFRRWTATSPSEARRGRTTIAR